MNKKKSVVSIIESSLISIASSFPIASSIATGWSEYKNHKQAERIEETLKMFAENLQKLNEEADEKFLNSDQIKVLIERTANLAKDELLSEKRKNLADFLANASTKRFSQDNEKDMILDTIHKISPLQITILKAVTEGLVLKNGRKNVSLGTDYDPSAKNKPDFKYVLEYEIVQRYERNSSKDNIEACIDYMVSIGIVELASARGWTTVGGKTGIRA